MELEKVKKRRVEREREREEQDKERVRSTKNYNVPLKKFQTKKQVIIIWPHIKGHNVYKLIF